MALKNVEHKNKVWITLIYWLTIYFFISGLVNAFGTIAIDYLLLQLITLHWDETVLPLKGFRLFGLQWAIT